MHKHLMAVLLPALILLSCNSNTGSNAVVAAPSGDSTFSRISEEFLAREIAWAPESAVALGFHQYDGKLTDYNRASLDSELNRLKAYDQRLAALDSATLSPKAFYDYRNLRAGILNSIFNFEDKGAYTQNPMTYAGAIDPSIYVKRN